MKRDQQHPLWLDRTPVVGGVASEGGATWSASRVFGLVVGLMAAVVVLPYVFVAVVLGMAGAADARAKAAPSLTSGGSYGSLLGPDGTARYNDGVRAKVGPAHRIAPVLNDDRRKPGDLTYEFEVTYINDSDKGFDVDAYEEVEAGYGMDAVMAEAAIDSNAPRSGEEWFPEGLAPRERVTVPLRFNVPAGTKFLTFETSVSEDYRDHAIWKLPLP